MTTEKEKILIANLLCTVFFFLNEKLKWIIYNVVE